ncbi:MAG TPA: cytochrome P450, partial [Alphaproteobacteria bacterium]|nr:cytochrome P450 [Alphaproteobacteria bacterium]
MSWRVSLDDFAAAARGLAWMAVERIRTGIVFNPLRADLRVDPHPFYRALREKDPFHRTFAGDGWVVSRYADVVEILTDKTLSADERNMRRWRALRARGARAGIPDPYDLDLSSMLRRDPPDHTRLRALVGKAFSPRAVARMRPRIASWIDELLGKLPSHGEIDWIRDFAAPLPVSVIAELLGVPARDRERFRRWSDDAVGLLGDGPRARVHRGLVAMRELGEYIASVAEERRRSP